MKDVTGALAAALRAPLRRWRLVLVLWLTRLLPVALLFSLPVYRAVANRTQSHPDAAQLLAPAEGGFTYAWTSDFFRLEMPGLSATLFWLVILCWLLVTVVAGGIVTRLVRGGSGLFLAECGRYAGRFLRLALVAAFFFYLVDLGVNGLLAESHAARARNWHVQDFVVEKGIMRGLLFVAAVWLLGVVHAYARIDIVLHERRSALLSFVRGFGTLLARLPKLLLLEIGMLLLAAAAAALAWLLVRISYPVGTEASWTPVVLFLLLALLGSYLRSGIELGAMEARVRLLGAPVAVLKPSQIETALSPFEEDASR